MDPLERLVEKPTTPLEKTWGKPTGHDKNMGEIAHHIYDEQDDNDDDKDDDDDGDKLFNAAFGFENRILPACGSPGLPVLQHVFGSTHFTKLATRKRREVCRSIEYISDRSLVKELLGLGSEKPPTESIEFSGVLDDDLLHVLKKINEASRDIIGHPTHVSPRKARSAILGAPSPIEMFMMFQRLSASGTSFQPLNRWDEL
jgi:hypothetical protein